MTGYDLGNRGFLVRFPAGTVHLSLPQIIHPGSNHFLTTVQGPTQPSIEPVPLVVSPVLNRLGRGADYSPLSSVGKNKWSYTSISRMLSWSG